MLHVIVIKNLKKHVQKHSDFQEPLLIITGCLFWRPTRANIDLGASGFSSRCLGFGCGLSGMI